MKSLRKLKTPSVVTIGFLSLHVAKKMPTTPRGGSRLSF